MKMRYSDTIRALSALLFLSVTLTGCAGKTGENSSTPQPSKEIDVTTYYEKHSTVATMVRLLRFYLGRVLRGRGAAPGARWGVWPPGTQRPQAPDRALPRPVEHVRPHGG